MRCQMLRCQKMSRSPKDVKKVPTICHVPKDVTMETILDTKRFTDNKVHFQAKYEDQQKC